MFLAKRGLSKNRISWMDTYLLAVEMIVGAAVPKSLIPNGPGNDELIIARRYTDEVCVH